MDNRVRSRRKVKDSRRTVAIGITTLGVIFLAIMMVQFSKTKSYAYVRVKRENTLEWLRKQEEYDANLYVELLKSNPYAKLGDKLDCLLDDSFGNIINIHVKGYTDERTAMLQLQPLFWIESQLENEKINNADAYRLLLLFYSEEEDSGENEEFMNFIYKEAQIYLPSPDDEAAMARLNDILNRLSSFLDSQNEKMERVVI